MSGGLRSFRREMLDCQGLSRGAVKPRQVTYQSLLGTRKPTRGVRRNVLDELQAIHKAQHGVFGKWGGDILRKVFRRSRKRRARAA